MGIWESAGRYESVDHDEERGEGSLEPSLSLDVAESELSEMGGYGHGEKLHEKLNLKFQRASQANAQTHFARRGAKNQDAWWDKTEMTSKSTVSFLRPGGVTPTSAET